MSRRLFCLKNQIKYFQPLTINTCKFIGTGNLPRESFLTKYIGKRTRKIKNYKPALDILLRYKEMNFIPWEKVKNEILNKWCFSGPNINSIILNCCLQSKEGELAASYFKHMLQQKEKPNMIETYLLLATLADQESIIMKNKNLLLNVYAYIKSDLKVHPSLLEVANSVYTHFDDCWIELVDATKQFGEKRGINRIYPIVAAFDRNEPDVGWNELYNSSDDFTSLALEAYLRYCLREANEGKFGPSYIDNIINYCSKVFRSAPKYPELLNDFEKIFNVANLYPNGKYHWTCYDAKVTKGGICLECKNKLNDVVLSEEDFSMLQSEFLRSVIINDNIYLKTSKQEIHSFLEVIEKMDPYDVVVDGLNEAKRKFPFQEIIHYFPLMGMKIFLIARKHSLREPVMKEAIKSCVGYFLTDNMSDDDVFTMYSALAKGQNTYIYTNDFFRGYPDYFSDPYLKMLFLKWQITHQYRKDDLKKRIIKPYTHANIPQLTLSNPTTLIYHIAVADNTIPRVTNVVSWICVQAREKK